MDSLSYTNVNFSKPPTFNVSTSSSKPIGIASAGSSAMGPIALPFGNGGRIGAAVASSRGSACGSVMKSGDITGINGSVSMKVDGVSGGASLTSYGNKYFTTTSTTANVSLTNGKVTGYVRGSHSTTPGRGVISTTSSSTPAPGVNITTVGGSSGFVGVKFDV